MGKSTWFPLPFAFAVVVINVLAVREVMDRLPGAPIDANEHVVPRAIAAYLPFAQGRVALLAGVFVVAALLFALVELGLGGRPAGLALGAGFLCATYLVAMMAVFALNPVTGYDEEFPEPSGGYSTMPFDMGALSPPWYRPLLGGVLLAAAIAQIVAVRGLLRRQAHVPSASRGTWLLLLPSAFVLAFAAANFASDRIARATAPPGSFWEADYALRLMVQVTAVAAVPAAGLAAHGILVYRNGVRPRSMLVVGVLTAAFVFTLPLVALGNLQMYSNEQSGFTEHLPGWREAVTGGILGAAALVQLAAFPLLARRERSSR
ncbi:hypothetical protein [Nonomuraea sp. NPDC050540]|uniref:hypothetical protein n=1 Tax=Nonomuraea sp. NPDC050540 TaxID=3364367 RepID=UPI0037A80296